MAKKILLVRPNMTRGWNIIARQPPAGLGYLAEALKKNKIDYDILDMALGYDINELIKKIKKFKPDLMALSVTSPLDYKNIYSLVSKIKEQFKLDVVIGGSFASTMRKDIMEQCAAVDFLVIQEGEKTLVELCEGKKLSEIKGVIYRKGSDIIYTGDRPFELNLDSIDFPKYEKFELKKYALPHLMSIVTSRGCPFQCTYCGSKLAIGSRLRVRSPESVVKEINYWYDRGYREIELLDDNFTLIPQRVYKVCDLLEKLNLKGFKLALSNGIRADRTAKEMLKRLRDVGFYHISFGVEGGNNKVLKAIKKAEKIEVIEEAIKNACEIGYDVNLLFLVGSPTETFNDFMDSVNLSLRYPISNVQFSNLIPLPNTELFDYLKKNDLFVVSPSVYLNEYNQYSTKPCFVTPEMPYKDRIRALKLARKIERKVVIRNLRRKAKKYGFFGRTIVFIYSYFFPAFLREKILKIRPLFLLKERLTTYIIGAK